MLHADEIVTDADLVRRLVAEQFPQWAGLAVRALASPGTDHRLFRLGDALLVRMPRIHWAAGQADSDARWLPVLGPHLPVALPVPVAVGEPGEGFPWRWSVVPWLPGHPPERDDPGLADVAVALAAAVRALGGVDASDAPMKSGADRGVPLGARDGLTRAAVDDLGDRVEREAVLRAWEASLQAPPWPGGPAWLHGDLLPGNLLVDGPALTAVIDWGALGAGDPAADLQPAWNLFDGASRASFREVVGCDDAAWLRGRGWVLSTALVALPYYWDSAPHIARRCRADIAAVLADAARGQQR